jgi:hypothetical protein
MGSEYVGREGAERVVGRETMDCSIRKGGKVKRVSIWIRK